MENTNIHLTDTIIERMSRESLIQHLEVAKGCMLSLEKVLTDYEAINEKIEKVEKKRRDIETGSLMGIIGSCVLCVISFGMAFAGLGDGEFGQVILGIILFVLGVKLIKKVTKENTSKDAERKFEAEQYYNQEYPPLAKEKQLLEEQRKEIVESIEFKNTRILVPTDYYDPDSVTSLIRILQNRRARSLSEAINTYEADLHNMRMEHAAVRSAEAAEKQAAHSADIAKNTKSTARAAKLNAFINFMK